MKRFLALLLILALLTGAACAAPLRPRRDAAAHEAHHEAHHDARWSDLPGEEALQDAETIEGSFTIDKNGVKTVYDLTLTLGVVYPETSVGDGEALELLAAHDFGLTTSDQFGVLRCV